MYAWSNAAVRLYTISLCCKMPPQPQGNHPEKVEQGLLWKHRGACLDLSRTLQVQTFVGNHGLCRDGPAWSACCSALDVPESPSR